MSEKRQNLRINGESNDVTHARNWLNQLLSTQQVDSSLVFQLETVFCEVLNNIITHSYVNHTDANYIDLHFRIIKRKILLTIDDFGIGIQHPIDKQVDLQAETGRGWLIIQAWTDNSRYWSFPTLNRHCLVKYF